MKYQATEWAAINAAGLSMSELAESVQRMGPFAPNSILSGVAIPFYAATSDMSTLDDAVDLFFDPSIRERFAMISDATHISLRRASRRVYRKRVKRVKR